jgi:hypothetical protein
MEHGVNAVLVCPKCDHELLVGVSVMPWQKEDGNNSKAEGEATSSKKQKNEDHGKNGTARVSFDGVSINTAQSSEESIGSNLDDDDTVDGSVSLLI